MFLSFYATSTRLLRPYFQYMLKKRLKKGKEDKMRLAERKGIASQPRPSGKLIWIHGASVGESLSALPLVDKILAEDPAAHVMMTTGTVTSARLMEKRLPVRSFHQFIPVDHPDWTRDFLDHWQPEAVIWLESDFWPNMLRQIKDRHIPAVLVNARMSERSFTRWRVLGAGMIRTLLSVFDFCLAQNVFEQQRLQHFGHDKVYVADNLKYAVPPLPVDDQKSAELKSEIGTRPVWQFISTHPGEEAIGFDIHRALKAGIPDVLTIIVPRHPDRGAEIAGLAAAKTLKLAQRSKNMPITHESDIYLADTMGELGLFSQAIPLVAMGGSFVPHGGHNPIEPAQFGCMVLYGPYMFNFKTICTDFETAKAALPVKGVEDLQDKLKLLLQKPDEMQPYRDAALKLTRDKSGAIETLWSYLCPWLGIDHAVPDQQQKKTGTSDD